MNYGAGEWMTYGFAPFAQSNGGDIIDRETWMADGTINSEANVATLTTLQDWNKAGYIVPASAGDNKFYGEKTAALSWVGNWMWPAHREGLGNDLVLIPPPKFGDAGREPLPRDRRECAALDAVIRPRRELDAVRAAAPESAVGPGIRVTVNDPSGGVGSNHLINGIQELRDAGAEVIELNDTVRVVAQTALAFVLF